LAWTGKKGVIGADDGIVRVFRAWSNRTGESPGTPSTLDTHLPPTTGEASERCPDASIRASEASAVPASGDAARAFFAHVFSVSGARPRGAHPSRKKVV